jgi:hypothetical protein
MRIAQDPVRFPTDPYPARPGTRDALTARTIDATVHPPLVRAQETVAAIIPRLAEPLGSPLLLAMLAGTLVLVWLARRAKLRPAGLLLSALLMITLTSFRPAGSDGTVSPPIPEPRPFIFEGPDIRERPTPRAAKRRDHHRDHYRERSLADQLIASFPEITIVAKHNAEMIERELNDMLREYDEEELRDYVKELRRRLRAEARRVARDR